MAALTAGTLVSAPRPRTNALSKSEQDQLATATNFLYQRIDFERSGQRHHPFKLQRTEELFRRLGLEDYLANLHEADKGHTNGVANVAPIPLVHIAGTKGKGSTATMVTSILQQAGYRVGLYTSPHLSDLRERFRINSQMCSVEELSQLIELLRPVVDQMDQEGLPVSFFELTTALALLYFVRSQVDAIVLEVGLGGRLDSTNVCQSTVTAITSIGLDHQQILGDTVEAIAAEKAGIIKSGVPLISGVASGGAATVIDQLAEQAGIPFFKRDRDFSASVVHEQATGSEFDFRWQTSESAEVNSLQQPHDPMQLKSLHLGLLGKHQVDNAAVAITVVKALEQRSRLTVSESAIAKGFQQLECPGRAERMWINPQVLVPLENASQENQPLPEKQLVIVDTAHNGDSIAALCQALRSSLDSDAQPGSGATVVEHKLPRPLSFVFGTTNDKDIAAMANSITDIADSVFATQYSTNPRALAAQQCYQAFCQATRERTRSRSTDAAAIHLVETPETALQEALRWVNQHALQSPAGESATPGTVVVCGSFFLAGQLRPQLLAAQADLVHSSADAAGPL